MNQTTEIEWTVCEDCGKEFDRRDEHTHDGWRICPACAGEAAEHLKSARYHQTHPEYEAVR